MLLLGKPQGFFLNYCTHIQIHPILNVQLCITYFKTSEAFDRWQEANITPNIKINFMTRHLSCLGYNGTNYQMFDYRCTPDKVHICLSKIKYVQIDIQQRYSLVLIICVVLEDILLLFFQKPWCNSRAAELITQRPGWIHRHGIHVADLVTITSLCYEAELSNTTFLPQ